MENDNLKSLEIDRIIHFLECEISSRRSEAMRPGWTTWAILGAMTSLLWLMFSVLDTNEFISWRNILYITLLLSVSFDFLFLLIRIFSSVEPKHLRSVRRFEYFENSIGSFLVFILFRAGVLLILIHLLSPKINNFVEFFCWLFLGWSLIQILLLLALYYLQVPISTNPTPRFKWAYYIYVMVWLTSGGLATVGLIVIIYFKVLVPSIPEWRIGFIIFGLSVLMLIFSCSKPISRLLLQLDDIRRKLSLGQIDLNRAKQQIDLIIHGLTLSDILQSNINDILVSLNTMRNIYEKYDSELRLIEKFIDTPIENLNKEDKTTVDAILRSLTERQNEILSAKESLLKNKAKLDRRISFFYGMSKDIAPDIENLFEEIDKENEKLNNIVEKAFGRLNRLKDKVGKHVKRIAQQPHARAEINPNPWDKTKNL